MSVVIPAYNVERYIADAVESALGQKDVRTEVIVVDDGSTDDTRNVVRSVRGDVRYIHQPNAGVSAARNCGIAAATCDLVAFLDADDVWLPEKLSKQTSLLEARPDLGLVYCAWRWADEDLEPYGPPSWAPPADALRNTLLLEPPGIWVSSTALLPREVLESVGGFDERLSTSADTDLTIRVGAGHAVDGVPEPLALYRQHAHQMHHDPDAMARDMQIVYGRAFASSLPDELRDQERRAWANLHTTLGLAYARERRLLEAARRITHALITHPGRASSLLASALGWRRHRSDG